MNATTRVKPAPFKTAPRLQHFPSRALLVAATAKMPYRMLQCLTTSGVAVHGFGSGIARGLRFSRRLRSFTAGETPVDGNGSAALAAELNAAIERFDIEVVVPGDAQASRSLIAVRDRLLAPSFPMPDLETFDRLNDKWRFYQLCKSLGVPVPYSEFVASKTDLSNAFESGACLKPKIAKPLSLTGSEGCLQLDLSNARDRIAKIEYAPIILQDYIEGEDIGASALCERGEIRAFIAHRYGRNVYQTFWDPRIFSMIEKIARATAYDGVFNFDMRLAPDGRVYYLECNPRIFFKIAMSKLAGVDFVALALGKRAPVEPLIAPPMAVRLPKALMLALRSPGKIEPQSWQALRMTLADPLPYIREELGLDEDLRKD
jgi:predicted ATP-grasp superfamily ATP-dependent carboligase